MPRTSFRHRALTAGMAAVIGVATVAPAAGAAATSSSAGSASAQTPLARGLFGDLLAPVGQVLDAITGGLTGALPPAAVETLTGALDALDPAQLAAVLDTLTPAQLAQVVAAGPDGFGTLLTGVLDTVTGLVGGLPTGGGSTPAVPPQLDAVLAQLTGLLTGVSGADAPSLATLTQVLDQLTSLLGLPGITSLPALGPLVGQLVQTRGTLPAGPARDAVDQVLSTVGDNIARNPVVTGVTSMGPNGASGASTTATATATDPGSPVKGATATKPAPLAVQARIRSVSVSKDRRRVRVRVTCPTGATAPCRIIVSAKLRGAKLTVTRRSTVRVGATRTITAEVPTRTARSVRRAGGRLVVRVGTSGSGKAAVTKSVAVRRAAR